MKALLICPEFPDTFWSFRYALKFIHRKASSPPLGLLTIASMLPEAWEKRLIDMNVEGLDDDDLRWADLVFVSAMSVQKESVKEVIALCKSAGVRIVAGGPLFTTEYKKILDTLYSPRRYYERIRTFLREYIPPQKKMFHFRLNYLAAFIRSMIVLGVIGKERFQYWRLLFRTVFSRPHLLPQAVTLSIYGFHFPEGL